mgnify:FL=1
MGPFLLCNGRFDLVVIFIYTNHIVRLYITSVIIRVINLYRDLEYIMMKGSIGVNSVSI